MNVPPVSIVTCTWKSGTWWRMNPKIQLHNHGWNESLCPEKNQTQRKAHRSKDFSSEVWKTRKRTFARFNIFSKRKVWNVVEWLFTNCQKLSTHIRKQQTQRVLIGANYFILKTISTKYAAISKILSFLAFASFFDPSSIFFQTWIYVQKIANNKSSKDQSKILFLKKTEL